MSVCTGHCETTDPCARNKYNIPYTKVAYLLYKRLVLQDPFFYVLLPTTFSFTPFFRTVSVTIFFMTDLIIKYYLKDYQTGAGKAFRLLDANSKYLFTIDHHNLYEGTFKVDRNMYFASRLQLPLNETVYYFKDDDYVYFYKNPYAYKRKAYHYWFAVWRKEGFKELPCYFEDSFEQLCDGIIEDKVKEGSRFDFLTIYVNGLSNVLDWREFDEAFIKPQDTIYIELNGQKLFEEVQHYFEGKDLQVEEEAIRKAGYFEVLENSQDSSIN